MTSEPILLLEPKGHAAPAFARLQCERLRTRAAVANALRSLRRAIWVAPTEPAVHMLATALAGDLAGDQRLLVLERPDRARRALLHAAFRFVVAEGEEATLLAPGDLAEVFDSPDRQDLFIGGAFDRDDEMLILYRGNLQPLLVPLASFPASAEGPAPVPSRLEITDCGQTVRLGRYEAAADAILYEHDRDFRRRDKKRRITEDRSIGGALRRLRLQKGFGRDDFPGISAKEIARIERGEVKTPHPQTLAAIAERLGVAVDELATF